jgi:hypothetical protein
MAIPKPAHILVLRFGAMNDIAVREHDRRADNVIDDHAVFAGQIAEAASKGESAWGQRNCPGLRLVERVDCSYWIETENSSAELGGIVVRRKMRDGRRGMRDERWEMRDERWEMRDARWEMA